MGKSYPSPRNALHRTAIHYTILYRAKLCCTALQFTVPHFTALYCTEPHYTTLEYTVLYCMHVLRHIMSNCHIILTNVILDIYFI